jgi:putative PEP-CTERM system TPR-repeat lipoprotein
LSEFADIKPRLSQIRLLAVFPIVLLCLAGLVNVGSLHAKQIDSESSSLFEDALRRFEDQDYAGSIIQLKTVLQANPKNLPARILIGRALVKMGNALAAEKELRRARLEGGDEELIAVPLASAFLLLKRNKEILETISAAGRSPEVEFELQVIRGQAHLGLLQRIRAEEAFKRAQQLRPDAAQPLLGLARVSLSRAHLYRANEYSSKAVAIEPDNFYSWYVHGLVARRLGRLPEAVDQFDKSLALIPEYIPTRVARAMTLIQLGRHAETAEDFAILNERLPNSPYTAYIDAHIKLHNKDLSGYQHGLQRANTLLRGLDREELYEDPRLLLVAGLVNFSLKNYNDSYNFLREHVSRNEFHAGSRYYLSRLMLRRGERRDALTMIKSAVELSPENPLLLQLLGATQMRNRFYEEASATFNRVVKARPKSISARTDLARSYIQSGHREEAETVLKETFELFPKATEPGIMLALLLLKQGKYDETKSIALAITQRAPKNPAGFNLLASAEWAKGEEAAARANLQHAITIDPQYLSAHRNLAKIDLKTGAVDAAKERYQKMLKMPGAGARPLIDLARIAAREGKLRDAISLMSKAREQAPENLRVELDLIALLGRSGDGDAALRNARKLLERLPQNPAVLEKLGHMEQAFGKPEEAAKAFRRAAEVFPENANRLMDLAQYQVRANDLSGAHKTLKRALVANDRHLGVLQAVVRLESLLGLHEDALLRTKLMINQFPENSAGYRLRGEVLTKLQRFKESAAAYDAAIKRKKSGSLLISGYKAQRASGMVSSLKPLEDWVRAHPEDYLSRRTLASAYLDTGNTVVATRLYEELATVRKDDPIVLNNLAGLYLKAGDERALESAEAAYRIAPKQPQTLDTLGWILVQNGQTARGLELLRDAFARASRRARIRYHLAVALNRQEKNQEAREHLEAILSMTTTSTELAEKSRKLLSTLDGG